jgi:hypothetical protein
LQDSGLCGQWYAMWFCQQQRQPQLAQVACLVSCRKLNTITHPQSRCTQASHAPRSWLRQGAHPPGYLCWWHSQQNQHLVMRPSRLFQNVLLPLFHHCCCCCMQASGILPRQHPKQIRFAVSLESAAYYAWIDNPQYMCK